MEQKRLSDRIEDTIEGFILFLYRYLYTFAYILLRPNRLSKTIRLKNRNVVPPFTFLAISSFLYAVIVSPVFSKSQPMSSSMMPNVGPDFNQIASDALQKISEATIANILLTGLPILLVISLLSYLTSWCLIAGEERRYWFSTYAYAYATHALLQVLSQFLFITTLLMNIPSISSLPDWSFNLPFWLIGAYAYLLPFLIVGLSYRAQDHDTRNRHKVRNIAVLVVSCLIIPFAYSQSGALFAKAKSALSPISGFKISLDDSYDIYKDRTGYIFAGVIYFDNPRNTVQLFDVHNALIYFKKNKALITKTVFYASNGVPTRLVKIGKGSREAYTYSFHVTDIEGDLYNTFQLDEDSNLFKLDDSIIFEIQSKDDLFQAKVDNPELVERSPIKYGRKQRDRTNITN